MQFEKRGDFTMSENERTPEQILEKANAFLEKGGVNATLEEFLYTDSVKSTVSHYARLCEDKIRTWIDEHNDELVAKAEEAGVCDGIKESFYHDFTCNFKIFMLTDHIEVLKAYGVEEESIFTMMLNALFNDSEILYRLVIDVCEIQCEKYYMDAYEQLKKLKSGEEDPEPKSVTCETCGEADCHYVEDCKKLGFCPKGKEFHCNGKGTYECNCPCADSCIPSVGIYPCEELNYTVIPPKGGCCERGVK